MTYVLNSSAALRTGAATDDKAAGFWQRLFAAIIESRRLSAERELRARSYLVNEAEIVLGGFPQTALRDDAELPFNR